TTTTSRRVAPILMGPLAGLVAPLRRVVVLDHFVTLPSRLVGRGRRLLEARRPWVIFPAPGRGGLFITAVTRWLLVTSPSLLPHLLLFHRLLLLLQLFLLLLLLELLRSLQDGRRLVLVVVEHPSQEVNRSH